MLAAIKNRGHLTGVRPFLPYKIFLISAKQSNGQATAPKRSPVDPAKSSSAWFRPMRSARSDSFAVASGCASVRVFKSSKFISFMIFTSGVVPGTGSRALYRDTELVPGTIWYPSGVLVIRPWCCRSASTSLMAVFRILHILVTALRLTGLQASRMTFSTLSCTGNSHTLGLASFGGSTRIKETESSFDWSRISSIPSDEGAERCSILMMILSSLVRRRNSDESVQAWNSEVPRSAWPVRSPADFFLAWWTTTMEVSKTRLSSRRYARYLGDFARIVFVGTMQADKWIENDQLRAVFSAVSL